MQEIKNSPRLTWIDNNNDKQVVYVEDENICVGSDYDCQVRILSPSIDAHHVVFCLDSDDDDYENFSYYAHNVGSSNVFVSNLLKKSSEILKPGKKIQVATKMQFWFGNISDRKNIVRIECDYPDFQAVESGVFTILPLPSADKINKEKDKLFKSDVDSLLEKYYERIQNVSAQAFDVCKSTVDFLHKSFSAANVMVYRKMGTRWKLCGIKRKSRRDTYAPSTSLFRKALDNGGPIFVRCEEGEVVIEGESISPTVSIIASSATKMFFLPLMDKDKCFGMLYLDTKDDEGLTRRDYDILLRIINSGGISSVLSGFLNERKSDIDFLKTRDPIPHDWPFRYIIGTKRICYPLVSFVNSDDQGTGRIIYGNSGDNLLATCSIKSFIEGLINGGNNNGFSREILCHIPGYMERLPINTDRLNLSVCDITLTYQPYEDRKKKIPEDESDYIVSIAEIGNCHVYANINGEIEELNGDKKNVLMLGVDDYVLISPIHRVPHKLLRGELDTAKIHDNICDFLLLIREK